MRFETVQTCLFNPLHVLLWIHSLIAFVFDTKRRELTGVKEKDGKHSIYIWEEMKSFSHTLYDSISYIFYQLVAAAHWSFASLLLPCTRNSAWHIMSAPREFKNNILQVWTVNLKTVDPPVGVARFEFAHIGCCSSRSLLFRKMPPWSDHFEGRLRSFPPCFIYTRIECSEYAERGFGYRKEGKTERWGAQQDQILRNLPGTLCLFFDSES